jgi:uncharacterized protein YihD (DUF1040 family)
MTYYQFMIHLLKNATSDYELKIDFLEKLVRNKGFQREVKELREELNLRFERLLIQSVSRN